MTVVVGRAPIDEWRDVKAARLLALTLDPSAFGSTIERERGFHDDVWRTRLAAGRTFLARSAGQVVGIVAYTADDDRPTTERQLQSMWVAPEARGAGVGTLLVHAVRDAAAAEGARTLTLLVADGNDAARRLYEALGFRPTGERDLLTSDPSVATLRYTAILD
ncbi:MAG: GNAT family N-acetyltransferase [Cellulomonas sp.]